MESVVNFKRRTSPIRITRLVTQKGQRNEYVMIRFVWELWPQKNLKNLDKKLVVFISIHRKTFTMTQRD